MGAGELIQGCRIFTLYETNSGSISGLHMPPNAMPRMILEHRATPRSGTKMNKTYLSFYLLLAILKCQIQFLKLPVTGGHTIHSRHQLHNI